MKRLIGAMMAVALLVSVAPVVAGDSFQALSRLPAGLTPLDDAQLAAVEGGQVDVCVVCLNIAVITPINVGVNVAVAVGLGGEVEIAQSGNQSINAAAFQANN
jgi:hypothetical protein